MINIKNLSFSYGEKAVFTDFSLEIADKITVLHGVSGCGKTTLIRIIAGIEENYTGTVERDFKKSAFMFQEDRLLPWFTAEENVLAAMEKADTEKARHALDLMELGDMYDSKPGSMSGGQQRRVAIARAIAYEPDILILDEPFKGLDTALCARVAERLKSLNIPIIATLHNDDEIKLLGGTIVELENKK